MIGMSKARRAALSLIDLQAEAGFAHLRPTVIHVVTSMEQLSWLAL
jgi:hypothetical protein